MQRAYQTIDEIYVNENNVSMFQLTKENGYYYIVLIVDYPQKKPLILFKGTQDEQQEIIKKLEMMNSYEDWMTLHDGSLARIDHIRHLEKGEEDGMSYIKISFGNNRKFTAFKGSEKMCEKLFEEMKKQIYAIVYDLQQI